MVVGQEKPCPETAEERTKLLFNFATATSFAFSKPLICILRWAAKEAAVPFVQSTAQHSQPATKCKNTQADQAAQAVAGVGRKAKGTGGLTDRGFITRVL